MIGAIRLGKRPTIMTNRGAVNGRVFLRFVRTRLVPNLSPGDIVVTQDYPLAALVLGKGAAALSPRGLIYSENNIMPLHTENLYFTLILLSV